MMKEIQRAIDALKEVPAEFRDLVVTEAAGAKKRGPKPGTKRKPGAKKPGPKPGAKAKGKPGPKPKVKETEKVERDVPVKISAEKAAKLKVLRERAGL